MGPVSRASLRHLQIHRSLALIEGQVSGGEMTGKRTGMVCAHRKGWNCRLEGSEEESGVRSLSTTRPW